MFTLPDTLNGWCQLHPVVLYRALSAAVWQTLKTFAADPKRLGGQLGITAVLHTWGQTLTQHVQLHCLFPVRALSCHFRGHLVSRLRVLFDAGQLYQVTAADLNARLDALMAKAWVVFNRPCEGATRQVVNYLARYSHRTAISNQRILAVDGAMVSFRYKDYGDG